MSSTGSGGDATSGESGGFTTDSDEMPETEGLSGSAGDDGTTTGTGSACPSESFEDSTFGTTLGRANTASGSCGGDQASDQAFEFTAAQDGNYTFSTDGSDFDTVLYVLDGDQCGGPELMCDDDGGDSTQSRVTVALIEGQAVVVVVDGYSDQSGAFTLTTSSQTADGCNPAALGGPLPVSEGGPTSGSSHEEGSCGGADAPELVFEWTAPDAGTYTIHTSGSDFDTLLYVRDHSCIGEELGCDDDGGPSTQSSLTLDLAANQNIVIIADGYSDSSGTIVVTIES